MAKAKPFEAEINGYAGQQHQTAVFIDASKESDAKEMYWERAHRFATSYNHDQTIKADVFIVVSGSDDEPNDEVKGVVRIYPYTDQYGSQTWKGITRGAGLELPATGLSKWAKGEGYNVVCFFAVAGRELT